MTRSNSPPMNILLRMTILAFLVVYRANAEDASPTSGFLTPQAFAQKLTELDKSDLVEVTSLTKSAGGHDVSLLTVSSGDKSPKPAILLLGSVYAPQLFASDLLLKTVEKIIADPAKQGLLKNATLYVIPRPNPDATAALFKNPLLESSVNTRSTDDDRDGDVDEDPNEDLNSDGLITQIRVHDDFGTHRPSKTDPRLLVPVDTKKGEKGLFRLFSEGIDNDKDNSLNEDGPGGVDFNRNHTFRYPFFARGAGPNQVSEPESRAIIDFAFDHPEIAVVFSFSPEDNLFHPAKPDPGSEKAKIKTTVLSEDSAVLSHLAEVYRTKHGGKDAPPSPKGEGSFAEWAYFHFGRFSLSTRGWWVPKATAQPEASSDSKDAPKANPDEKSKAPAKPKEEPKAKIDAVVKKEEAKPSKEAGDKKDDDEKSTRELLAQLNWLKEKKIAGFVEWKQIEHPDFPGKKVEVGGIIPLVFWNPPAAELDELSQKHLDYFQTIAEGIAKVSFRDTKTEARGDGVYRIETKLVNEGLLPTVCEMGKTNGEPYPLQVTLELPAGSTVLLGKQRQQIEPLAGLGGTKELNWLVHLPASASPKLTLRAKAPAIRGTESTVSLSPAKP